MEWSGPIPDHPRHAHALPIPVGWDADETISWLEQRLALPGGEPAGWLTVVCAGDADDCLLTGSQPEVSTYE